MQVGAQKLSDGPPAMAVVHAKEACAFVATKGINDSVSILHRMPVP